MRTPGRVLLGVACAWSLVLCGPATSAVLPSGFTESLVAGGLTNPTAMEFAPDGRLFVAEQGGQLRVIKDGSLLPTPFVSADGRLRPASAACSASRSTPTSRPTSFVYVYYTADVAARPQPRQPLHRQRRRRGAGQRAACSSTSRP